MRKQLLSLALVMCSALAVAQNNSEIYVFPWNAESLKARSKEVVNISKNPGYDNQPFFTPKNELLFASTRNGQTDIALYDIKDESLIWASNTPGGSEYSPQQMPQSKNYSAVRLDTTGLQMLYAYQAETGKFTELLPDVKVGYYLWLDTNRILTTVLVENRMDLILFHRDTQKQYVLHKNVGRCLQFLPDRKSVSYVARTQSGNELYQLQLKDLSSKTLYPLGTVEDYAWLPNRELVYGSDQKLIRLNPFADAPKAKTWATFTTLVNISRIAIGPNHVAFVAEPSPEVVVQEQLDAYNRKDLEGFMNTYSDDIKLYTFPDQLSVGSREQMWQDYKGYFDRTPDLHAKLVKRMVLGNKVIDQEEVTANGRTFQAVAIYEVRNGKIYKVTFLR